MPVNRHKNVSFWDGVRSAVPIIIGFLPAGMTFGILAAETQLNLLDVMGFSGIVFAGASQYMALTLLQAGIPVYQIILATFLLNFRHFLMSSSLASRTQTSRALFRFPLAFGITDETFAIASAQKGTISAPYLFGLNTTAWITWQAGSVSGYIAGGYLPDRLEAAMGVALYALFAALLIPRIRIKPVLGFAVAGSGVLHMLLRQLPGLNRGWAFVVAIVVTAGIASFFHRPTLEDIPS